MTTHVLEAPADVAALAAEWALIERTPHTSDDHAQKLGGSQWEVFVRLRDTPSASLADVVAKFETVDRLMDTTQENDEAAEELVQSALADLRRLTAD